MRIYFVLSIALVLAVASEAIKSKKLKKVISGHHKTTKGMLCLQILVAIISFTCGGLHLRCLIFFADDFTLNLFTPGKLKKFSDRGGNRTRDLWFAS